MVLNTSTLYIATPFEYFIFEVKGFHDLIVLIQQNLVSDFIQNQFAEKEASSTLEQILTLWNLGSFLYTLMAVILDLGNIEEISERKKTSNFPRKWKTFFSKA